MSDNEEEEYASVIVDNGSGMMKAGFEGHDKPCGIIASIVGRPRYHGKMIIKSQQDPYIGEEAQKKQRNIGFKISN